MDLSLSPAEREFRDDVRGWLQANHPGPEPDGDRELFEFRRNWQKRLNERGNTSVTVVMGDGDALGAPLDQEVLTKVGRDQGPELHLDHDRDNLGEVSSARTIDVDERLRVQDGLWAIGDVTGKGAFTHVSMYQNAIARRDILGEDGPPASYHALPHVTFCDPEVAGVGLTEAGARAAGLRVRTGSTTLEDSSRGYTHGPGARGLIKVVEDADRGVLVGATVVGPAGGEILGFLAVAVHAAVPVDTLRSMIYAYPTFHRAIESALAELSEASPA